MGKKPWLLLTAALWFGAAYTGCTSTPNAKDKKDTKFGPSPTFSRNDASAKQTGDVGWAAQSKGASVSETLNKTQTPANSTTSGSGPFMPPANSKPAVSNTTAPVSLGPTEDPSAALISFEKSPDALKVVKPPPPQTMSVTQTNRPVDSEIYIVPSKQAARGEDMVPSAPLPPANVAPALEMNSAPPLPSNGNPTGPTLPAAPMAPPVPAIPSFGPPPVSLPPIPEKK